MAGYNLSFSVLVGMALWSLVSSAQVIPPTTHKTQDLLVTTEEMQRASYFNFVMLIKMAQFDERFQKNVTFLMPSDRMLSKMAIMPQDSVTDFLLHHSIPSPLLFHHLKYIPTGSFIPSSAAEYMLRISNHGGWNFLLNNVKLISPNICTAGSSIRCHGVDGVLSVSAANTLPPSPCPTTFAPSSYPPNPPPSPSSSHPPNPPPFHGVDGVLSVSAANTLTPPTTTTSNPDLAAISPPFAPSSDPPTPPPSPSSSVLPPSPTSLVGNFDLEMDILE